MNDITDPAVVDRLTGNAALNAVPVRVEPVEAEPAQRKLQAVAASR